MTPKRYEAGSVRQLSTVVDGMADRVSSQRMEQLRMVLGMWDRAVGREEMAGRSLRRAQQFFTRPVLEVFWDLAAAGELRAREEDRGKELPLATLRIVRDCLVILCRELLPGKRLWLPSVPNQELKDTVPPAGVAALYRGLVDMAGRGPLERDGTGLSHDDRTRLLAMVAVVLDAAPRSGELARMRLDDLAAGEVAIGVRRRQQKAGPNRAGEIAAIAQVDERTVRAMLGGELDRASEATRQRVLSAAASLEPLPEVEWYPLREGARVALRRWLHVREALVNAVPLEGARTALWVSLQTTGPGGPVGMPLGPIGIRKGYVRGVTALNFVMAGQYGWEPLPTRMEQLRRAVDVVPLDGPPE